MDERSPEEQEAFDTELNRGLLDPSTQADIKQKIALRLLEILPERCQRPGCDHLAETYCPLCEQLFCAPHDVLPDGHVCLRDR